MTSKELLRDVLHEYLEKTDNTAARLARVSGVPKRTLNRWLSGDVLHPHEWQPLIKVAVALALSESEANRLLKAAGKDTIRALRRSQRTEEDKALLATFDAPAHSVPAPFMAPPNLTQFVGRTTELAELKAAVLSAGCAAVCDVSGMGGTGKTSLAIRLAYALREAFSDGVLWARLDASDSMTILHQWARQLGGDVSQYRDVESRAAEVRALLAHKRVLVVLDNAENSKQVRPLLPPSDGRCAVVITTRVNGLTATDGWVRLALEPFAADSGESLELFEKYLGKPAMRTHRAALGEMADLLGHLPLALAIVAGRLSAEMQHVSKLNGGMADAVAVLLAELREASTRLHALQRDDYDVRASFEVSYAALPPDLQQFFVQLCVFGGEDFSLEAVAFVNDLIPEATQAHLKALIQRSLVQPSHDGRYRLHPLLRDYARERMSHTLTAKQQMRVSDRMVAYFVESVGPNTAGGIGAICKTSLPDADRDNAWEALRMVNQLPWQHDVSVQRIETLCSFLQQRDAAAKVEPHLRQAIENAEAAGDTAGSLTLRLRRVYVLWWRGDDPDDAAEQLLDLALKNNHPAAYDALRLLAMFARMRGDFDASRSYYQRSLPLAQSANHVGNIILALVGLGDLCCVLEDYSEAQRYLEQAEGYITAETNIRLRILVHQQLGLLRCAQGRTAEATRLLDESIELSRQIGRDDLLLGALGDRADAALMDGNIVLDVARACASESLEISRRMGFAHGVSDSLERLGKCARLQGEWSGAQKFLDEALAVATKASINECKASVNFEMAQLSLARGDVAAARTYAQASLMHYGATHPVQSGKVRKWLEALKC
jgi:Tfp pilus assembly protein PilF/transcriptional regulator with XRE-family HTH domain